MLRERQIIGGLVVLRGELGNFSTEVVNLMQTFAAQSVLAIQNARLFREIEEKSRQLEVANQPQVGLPGQCQPRPAHAAELHHRVHPYRSAQNRRPDSGSAKRKSYRKFSSARSICSNSSTVFWILPRSKPAKWRLSRNP